MNDNGDTWEDSTGSGGFNMADGLRINSHIPAAADMQFEFVALRMQGNTGSAFTGLAPDLELGLYLRRGRVRSQHQLPAHPRPPRRH